MDFKTARQVLVDVFGVAYADLTDQRSAMGYLSMLLPQETSGQFEINYLGTRFMPLMGVVHFIGDDRPKDTDIGTFEQLVNRNWQCWFAVEIRDAVLCFRLCKSGEPEYEAFATGTIRFGDRAKNLTAAIDKAVLLSDVHQRIVQDERDRQTRAATTRAVARKHR